MKVPMLVKNGARAMVDLTGPQIQLLAPSEDGSYYVMKGTLPAGVSVPLHNHADPESFYVLSGEAQFLAQTDKGMQWQTVCQGDFVHVPGGTKHAWRNVSDEPCEVILALTPKLGEFLLEMGHLAKTESRSGYFDKVHELEERYGYWSASAEENAAVGIKVTPPSVGRSAFRVAQDSRIADRIPAGSAQYEWREEHCIAPHRFRQSEPRF